MQHIRAVCQLLPRALVVGSALTLGLALVACDGSNTAGDDASNASSGDVPAQTSIDLDAGREAFTTAKCVMCHGPDGKGTSTFLDLTDNKWFHCDGSIEGILEIMRKGIPKEAMKDKQYMLPMAPSTKELPDEASLRNVAAYVKSLSGAE